MTTKRKTNWKHARFRYLLHNIKILISSSRTKSISISKDLLLAMNSITFQVHLKTAFKLRNWSSYRIRKAAWSTVSCNLKLYQKKISAPQDHMQHSPSTLVCPHALSPPHNTHVRALTGWNAFRPAWAD